MPPKEWEHPVWEVTTEEVVVTEYYVRAATEQEAREQVKNLKNVALNPGDPQVIRQGIVSVNRVNYSQ